jgi:hypothetical protein
VQIAESIRETSLHPWASLWGIRFSNAICLEQKIVIAFWLGSMPNREYLPVGEGKRLFETDFVMDETVEQKRIFVGSQ